MKYNTVEELKTNQIKENNRANVIKIIIYTHHTPIGANQFTWQNDLSIY